MDNIKSVSLALILSLFLFACGQQKSQEQAKESAEDKAVAEYDQKSAELQKSWDLVFGNLPPATEVAARIQATGADFMPDLINDPANLDAYLQQQDVIVAANLGVYATDVGYLAAYEQGETTRNQFNTARKLAAHLGTERSFIQFMADRFSDRIKENPEAQKLINDALENASQKLRTEDRELIAAAAATGWFLEGLYLLTQMANNYPTDLPEEVRNIIMIPLVRGILNQEKALDHLIGLDSMITGETFFIYDLQQLKISYEKLEIDKTLAESNPGTTLTSDALVEISEQVATLRERIVTQ